MPCKLCGHIEGDPELFPLAETSDEAKLQYSPRVQQLLLINKAPTPSELTQLVACIAQAEGIVQELDHRLDETRKLLVLIAQEREQYRRTIVEYKKIVHPIRRLPPDILQAIFLQCVEEDMEKDFTVSSLDPGTRPWAVSQVSRTWRSIALSFHRMWSTIRVVVRDDEPSAVRKKTQALLAQIQRTASHPLSVSIMCSEPNVPLATSLVPILLSTSMRWREFCLIASFKIDFTVFHSLTAALSSLETLHLWILSNSSEMASSEELTKSTSEQLTPAASELPVVFQFTPRLRTVFSSPEATFCSGLPVSQIVKYDCPWIGDFGMYDFIAVLDKMPRLEVCIVQTLDTNGNEHQQAIEHQHLRSLSIMNAVNLHIPRNLVLPSLRRLEIVGNCDKSSLLLFLEQPHVVLEDLRLIPGRDIPGRDGFVDHETGRILQALPTLKALTISLKGPFDLAWLQPYESHTTEIPAPLLNSLSFESSEEFNHESVQRLQIYRPGLTFSGGGWRFRPGSGVGSDRTLLGAPQPEFS
ncbi:hypothetical protein C8J56DRAFT_479714 [Mycena floridula]|nr:hypothetical protein C8J56DRAFT_479714 [Mycena floridula]